MVWYDEPPKGMHSTQKKFEMRLWLNNHKHLILDFIISINYLYKAVGNQFVIQRILGYSEYPNLERFKMLYNTINIPKTARFIDDEILDELVIWFERNVFGKRYFNKKNIRQSTYKSKRII